MIAESLAAGCIPVISDETPWTDLNEKNCGFVCRLGDDAAFADALTELSDMDEAEHARMRSDCYAYISSVNEESVNSSGYRVIFG